MSEPKSGRELFDELFPLPKNISRDELACKELAAKDAIIAELVRLLGMGRDLYQAAIVIEAVRQTGSSPHHTAEEDARRILSLYDQAIEQYGGKE